MLAPDTFIHYRITDDFVSDLQRLEERLRSLVPREPARVADLYEAFIAGCYERADNIDDSDGSFGDFFAMLFCGCIAARQAAGADAGETVDWVLAWMDDDPYGFCHDLARHAAEVLDPRGLAAFVNRVRARFDAATDARRSPEGVSRNDTTYDRERWAEALRRLYIAQHDLSSFRALAEENGLTSADCYTLATMTLARDDAAEALGWAERGLELAAKGTTSDYPATFRLEKLRRDLLVKLDRPREALESAWTEYLEQPSAASFHELMEYAPDSERSVWRERALDASAAAHLSSRIELLVAAQEPGRLVELVDATGDQELESLSHSYTRPAAEMLEASSPRTAARRCRAQALRILTAKKSKYYDAALANLESAKRCFERAGLVTEWERTVTQLRDDHHRKVAFMPGFERLVAGHGPSTELSFLERAKSRWSHPPRRHTK